MHQPDRQCHSSNVDDAEIMGRYGSGHSVFRRCSAAHSPGAMIVDWRRDLAAPAGLSRLPLSCHDGVMGSQRFRAVIAAGPRNSAVIMVPLDPNEAWGGKADHPVSGTIGGCRTRTRLVPAGRRWVLPLTPKRLISMGIAVGDEVMVELTPEGPGRPDRPVRRRACGRGPRAARRR